VVLELDGQSASGQGVATDILEAGGRAYVRALSVATAKVRAAQAAEDPRADEPAAGTVTP